MKKPNEIILDLEKIRKSIRKDWGTFSPITRIKPDKKKYKRKEKHKSPSGESLKDSIF